jgi:hypothetical protein
MATDPGNDHEISATANDGIQLPRPLPPWQSPARKPGKDWAIYGSDMLLTLAGNSKTDGALGEPLISGIGSNSNPTVTVNLPDWGEYSYYTVMATDPGGCTPDANSCSAR